MSMLFKRIKNWAVSITSFRTGDVIPVDGPSGTAKIGHSDLAKEVIKDSANNTAATEADMTADAKLPIMTAGGPKALPANLVAKQSDVDELQGEVENLYTYDELTYRLCKGYYINTSVGDGNTVSFTPVENVSMSSCTMPCQSGDVFKIRGVGGTSGRLWCFVDSSDKVVAAAEASATTDSAGLYVVAPVNGKVIVNIFHTNDTYGTPYLKKRIPVEERVNKDRAFFEKSSTTYNNVASEFTEGYRIVTNTGFGTTVDYTLVAASTYGCYVRDCTAGEKFYLKGASGSESRLWCFADSSDKIVSVARSDATTGDEEIELTAPVDGKVIVNAYKSSNYSFKELSDVQTYVDELFEKLGSDISILDRNALVYKDVYADFFDKYRITTNVGVGNAVDYTMVSASGFHCYVRSCTAGEKFYLKGIGGGSGRLWCFVNSSDKVVSVARSDATTGDDEIELTAPVDGKVIINVIYTSRSTVVPIFRVLYPVQTYVDERFSSIGHDVSVMQKYDLRCDGVPYSGLGNRLAGIDLTDPSTAMTQVYAGYDALVEEFPDLIEKFDAAILADLEYPAYANGVGSGDPDYLETPAYKTFIYKISNTKESAGNTTSWVKKKLFITGSVHGVEFVSSVNCLSLALHICKDISDDLFTLLSLFDVWIMPCVNGYGIIHQTRYNANGIDINRNYGTINWSVIGSPGDGDYSGTTPDSEFETRLVEAMKDYIGVDFYVDHHCTPAHRESQFYTESASKKVFALSYKACVDYCRALVKDFPQYFGTRYQLFTGSVYNQKLPYGLITTEGIGCKWYYEQGVEACTIEVYGYINFTDGAYDSAGTRYNEAYWQVCELSLRSQLCNFLPLALE